MSPYSERSKRWRESNLLAINQWKSKYAELLGRRRHGGWDAEKFEMEIGSSLPDQYLREIWFFSTAYVSRFRRSKLGKYFVEAINEIRDYGTIEPTRKSRLLKAIKTTRRKMRG